MTPLTAALAYLNAKLSVLPVGSDKRPLIAWKEFQFRRPDETEVRDWYRPRRAPAGVAIVCGAISELAVLDHDPRNGDGLNAVSFLLPPTVTVKTGGGGSHHNFRLRPDERIAKIPGLLPGVDLQAEASYVVAPPSMHPSGRRYRFVSGRAFGEVPIAPLPAVIRDLIGMHRRRRAGEGRSVVRPPVGACGLTLEAALSRLDGARRVSGQWLARCPAHDDREPSLSLTTGADGRLLLHCFAGCAFGDILHALEEAPA